VRELEQAHLDLRVALLPVAQHDGKDAEGRRGGDRHVEPPHLQLQGPAHLATCALGVAQRRARLAQELLAGRGEPHAAGEALHKLAPELALERPDLLRQGRLGDEQGLGRGGQRPALGDDHEVLELPKVQGHKYYLSQITRTGICAYAVQIRQ
jgi:hypothetical protein